MEAQSTRRRSLTHRPQLDVRQRRASANVALGGVRLAEVQQPAELNLDLGVRPQGGQGVTERHRVTIHKLEQQNESSQAIRKFSATGGACCGRDSAAGRAIWSPSCDTGRGPPAMLAVCGSRTQLCSSSLIQVIIKALQTVSTVKFATPTSNACMLARTPTPTQPAVSSTHKHGTHKQTFLPSSLAAASRRGPRQSTASPRGKRRLALWCTAGARKAQSALSPRKFQHNGSHPWPEPAHFAEHVTGDGRRGRAIVSAAGQRRCEQRPPRDAPQRRFGFTRNRGRRDGDASAAAPGLCALVGHCRPPPGQAAGADTRR